MDSSGLPGFFTVSEFNVILFGIELNINGRTFVVLNPGKFIIPSVEGANKIFAYIIAPDKDIAENVDFLSWSNL
ncbi:MAG: hypothetical protein AAFO91_00350 [Bacteroidota bacterium]